MPLHWNGLIGIDNCNVCGSPEQFVGHVISTYFLLLVPGKYLQAEKLLASKKLGDTYGVWVKQFKRRKAPVARRKASRTRRSFGGDVNKTQVPRKKAKKHTGETKGKRGRSRKKDIEDSDENDENKENIAPPRRLMA